MSKKNVSFFGFTLLFLTAAIISFTGCKKDSSNPVGNTNNLTGGGSITLNGSGFSNKTINFAIAGAQYHSASNATIVGCSAGGTDSSLIGIYFPGNSTGTYNWAVTSNSFVALYVYSSPTKSYTATFSNGQTKITKYDAVGGRVEGTFSGYLNIFSGTSLDSVNVSGSFSAIRTGDY